MFSSNSIENLQGVHPDLQTLFHAVVKNFNCSIISGIRTEDEQQELYAKGRTDSGEIVTYKDGIVNKSKHQLGLAVDVVPYPSMYRDPGIMEEFGMYVLDVASDLKTQGLIDSDITWGGVWRWKDLPHFEI